MRVTDRMVFNQITGNLQKNRGEMTGLQNQAATQKRVTRPSEDPIAATRVLGLRTDERGSLQFIKSIQWAKSFLEFSDQSLSEMTDVLVRLKELAIQQSSDAGASFETRSMVAQEVEQAFNQSIQIGNRKLGERYIFGGFQTTHAPFNLDGEYFGDDGDMKIHVDKDAFIPMNLPGSRVFLGHNLGEDGLVYSRMSSPRTEEELIQYQTMVAESSLHVKSQDFSSNSTEEISSKERTPSELSSAGVNIYRAIKDFEIGLRVGDKEVVQSSVDTLDQALSQVIHARAQLGARIQTLNQTMDSLQKAVVSLKGNASLLEDVDLFQVVSDMTKADSALRATMETSGRLTQKNLIDFLR